MPMNSDGKYFMNPQIGKAHEKPKAMKKAPALESKAPEHISHGKRMEVTHDGHSYHTTTHDENGSSEEQDHDSADAVTDHMKSVFGDHEDKPSEVEDEDHEDGPALPGIGKALGLE